MTPEELQKRVAEGWIALERVNEYRYIAIPIEQLRISPDKATFVQVIDGSVVACWDVSEVYWARRDAVAPTELRDLLSLVMPAAELPSMPTIFGWTFEQRAAAESWAALEHLYASDNDVERVAKPSFLG